MGVKTENSHELTNTQTTMKYIKITIRHRHHDRNTTRTLSYARKEVVTVVVSDQYTYYSGPIADIFT